MGTRSIQSFCEDESAVGISEKAQESRDWSSERRAGVCTGRIGGCPVLGLSTTGGESPTGMGECIRGGSVCVL